MKLTQKAINFTLYRTFATPATKPIKSKWNSVVGLEVHAQINSKSKLFSGAANRYGAPPNTCVSPFDAAIPGTLPVLNERCVIAGIQTALALSCTVNEISMFDRKHYFYADMPAGYQITQQRAPLASNGMLSFYVTVPGVAMKPYKKTVRLHQLQLEQDSGKSIHDPILKRSLIDLNRAGVPLMEMVFEPDLSTGEEAASLVKELVLILKAIGVCSCRMHEGALRVDANISINKDGDPLGTRTEVKNISTIRGVADAVNFEIKRQIGLVEGGGTVQNETRSWDTLTKKTIAMRDKEVLHDYRFMPEPNLLPLRLNVKDDSSSKLINVEGIRKSLPELPEQTRNNLISKYDLKFETAVILVNDPTLLEYFNQILQTQPSITMPSKVANYLINEVVRLCNKNKIETEDCPIPVANLGELIKMWLTGTINYVTSSEILEEMMEFPDRKPSEIADNKKLWCVTDPNEITSICQSIIDKNPKPVQQYKDGKESVFRFFMRQIEKAEPRANMKLASDTLKDLLKK